MKWFEIREIEWISIKDLDRLPPMFQNVLVSGGGLCGPWIARRWTGCNEGAAKWCAEQAKCDVREVYQWLDCYDYDVGKKGVTHWMPLPESPHREGK